MTLRVLVVGGLTLDVIKSAGTLQRRVGGGAYYCSLAGTRLGARVQLRTVVGPSIRPEPLSEMESEGVTVVAERAPSSIEFVNSLVENGRRVQEVISVGGPPIKVEPDAIEGFDLVHITPVLGEVDPSLAELGLASATAIEVQGFVRERRTGALIMKHWEDRDQWIRRKLLVHLSDEELPYFCRRSLKEALVTGGPEVIVMTRSARGSFILNRERTLFIPALPVDVIDDVGCGDVYSMAMALSMVEGKDLLDSAVTATAAATLTAEGRGLEKLRLGMEFDERKSMALRAFQEFGLASARNP